MSPGPTEADRWRATHVVTGTRKGEKRAAMLGQENERQVRYAIANLVVQSANMAHGHTSRPPLLANDVTSLKERREKPHVGVTRHASPPLTVGPKLGHHWQPLPHDAGCSLEQVRVLSLNVDPDRRNVRSTLARETVDERVQRASWYRRGWTFGFSRHSDRRARGTNAVVSEVDVRKLHQDGPTAVARGELMTLDAVGQSVPLQGPRRHRRSAPSQLSDRHGGSHAQ